VQDSKKPPTIVENRETDVCYSQRYRALTLAEDVRELGNRGEPLGERLDELTKVLREDNPGGPMLDSPRIQALVWADRLRLMRTSQSITNRCINSLINILDGDF